MKKKLKLFNKNDFVIKPALSRGGRDTNSCMKNLKGLKRRTLEEKSTYQRRIIFSRFVSKTYFKFPAVLMERLLTLYTI